MSDKDNFDITAKVGEFLPIHTPDNPPEWPMYSFERPSRILWNAIGKRLNNQGWSEERICEWLQSKSARYALDGELGRALRDAGTAFADRMVAGSGIGTYADVE